jgi:hypothetical protein
MLKSEERVRIGLPSNQRIEKASVSPSGAIRLILSSDAQNVSENLSVGAE